MVRYGSDWVATAQDRDQWWVPVNMVAIKKDVFNQISNF
jgi:hypothetical protein